ncbi:hypothetical protein HYX05_00605 [Candidatus Woesearchaeota archaeon]|nr:hypothetical protein [Candidatus Woesearchaeota archaeon]
MITPNTEKQLRGLGLNGYEVKIWTALLSRGASTAGELSGIANIPRSRSYDVLESLKKKGFVKIKNTKPVRYTAISPTEALENTKKNTRESASGEIKKLDKLKNTSIISKLTVTHTKEKPTDQSSLSGVLRGRTNLYNHIEYIMNKAEKYVLIYTTEKEIKNIVRHFTPLFKKLKNKGTKIKIATQTSSQTKKFVGDMKEFAEVTNTNNKARFCIVDGKEIVFMVLDDSEIHPVYDVGIWMNTNLAKDLGRFILSNQQNQLK